MNSHTGLLKSSPLGQLFLLISLSVAGFLLGSILSMLYMLFVGGIDLSASSAPMSQLSALHLKVLQGISATAIFLLPATVYMRVCARSSSVQALTWKTDLFFLLTASVAIICMMPTTNLLRVLNEQIHFPASWEAFELFFRTKQELSLEVVDKMLSERSVGGFLSGVFVVAIMAAVCEELFFRGALQPILVRLFGNHHAGIWVAALIFGAVHLQFFLLLPLMFLGALLGYMAYYGRSLMPAIVAHFVNNFLAITIHFLFADSPHSMNYIEHIGTGTTWSYALFGVLAVFLIMKMWQHQYNNGR